ncbi:bifunctional diguanylate cyclase/phosphodiesterase [Pseudoalteromonas sp. T1lg88]|uniref:bifunctional diguanylate cyclase/phosphodiesterase n=1 Tax=Pseudoalteromonas sp. T1lg88 TaxID=2077104 RepID=UPI000CF6D70C|nr:EAL domain-containing protein [Pseudoalteromonas sp. T1lg88]
MRNLIHPSHAKEWSQSSRFLVIALVVLGLSLLIERLGLVSIIEHYILLHSFLELVSIIVSVLIFAVGWSARSYIKSPTFIFVSGVMLWVGVLDFQHVFSFQGMPEFITPASADKAINFWFAGRIFTAVAIIALAAQPWLALGSRSIYPSLIVAGMSATFVSYVFLFHPDWLPPSYIPGQGLTDFKRNFEYFLMALYAFAALLFLLRLAQVRQSRNLSHLFVVAVLMVLSEYYFTLYTHISDTLNLCGHLYKIVAYILLYQVLFVETITRPFLDLERSRHRLSATLSALPELVFEIDEHGKILRSHAKENEPFLLQGESIGRSIYTLFAGKDQTRLYNTVAAAKRQGMAEVENIVVARQQQQRHYQCVVVKLAEQGSANYLVVVRDVSERAAQVDALAHEARLKEGLLGLSDVAYKGCESALLSHGVSYARYLVPCQSIGLYAVNDDGTYQLLAGEGQFKVTQALDLLSQLSPQLGTQEHVLHPHWQGQSSQESELSALGVVMAVPVRDQEVLRMVILLSNDQRSFSDREVEAITIWSQAIWHWLNRLRQEERMHTLSLAVEQNPHPILITDTEVKIEYVNRAYVELCGFSREQLLGNDPAILSSGKTAPQVYQSMWQNLTAQQPWVGELINRNKQGQELIERTTIYPIKDKDGKVSKYISFQHDITAQIENETKIHHLSYYDQLTGLANGKMLLHVFASLRSKNRLTEGALLFIGLDNFKVLNEALGYEKGNLILKTLAQRLLNLGDEDELICRLPGDRFAFLMPYAKANSASCKAQRVLESLRTPINIDGKNMVLTASIGVALYPHDGDNSQRLLQLAEAALFEVKKRGRNNFLFYAREMNQHASRQLQVINALNMALLEDELSLVFQPQVRIDSRQVVGAEVLLRWHSSELGQVSPGEFIPVAESAGLIKALDAWVFRHALAQIKQWLAMGVEDLVFAVNLSAASFEDQGLLGALMRELEIYEVPLSCIELELTEAIALMDPDSVLKRINSLRAAGFRVSIDDFGTGYSSMSYLKRFAVDKLKIDKSFIDDLASGEPADVAIVKAMVQLAKALNIGSIAEGVETEQQWQCLAELGCDQVQGYWCAKPLAAEDFIAFIARWE